MDRLSLWAAAARAEGMRYGDWVAKYHPPDAQGRKPPHDKTMVIGVCCYCGKEFYQQDHRQRKYCGEVCRQAANEKRKYIKKAAEQSISDTTL